MNNMVACDEDNHKDLGEGTASKAVMAQTNRLAQIIGFFDYL